MQRLNTIFTIACSLLSFSTSPPAWGGCNEDLAKNDGGPLRQIYRRVLQAAQEDLLAQSTIKIGQFQLQAPPIGVEFSESIKAYSSVGRTSGFNLGTSEKQAALDRMTEAASRDPYFHTLGEKALESFVYHVSIRGPATLTPELALIRVQRDFDPNLPQELIMLADLVLRIKKIRHLMGEIWSDLLLPESEFASMRWLSLAPTFKSAEANFRTLQEELRIAYGSRFSQVAFDKAVELGVAKDPEVWTLFKSLSPYSDQGKITSASIQEKFRAPLRRLADRLRLPQSYDVFDLPRDFDTAVFRFGPGRLSYERYLIVNYAPEEFMHILDGKILFLVSVTKIHEVLIQYDTPKNTDVALNRPEWREYLLGKFREDSSDFGY